MKNILFKELCREIWRTKTRFLSILAIIAVGTGFFAGIKSSCPDMKETAQQYFSENRLMDLHLISTLGFSEDDIAAVKQVEGIRGMMPAYSVDSFVSAGDGSNLIVKALSYHTDIDKDSEDYLNRPVLKEGRLPQRSGECIVENSKLAATNFQLGSKIKLFLDDDEITDYLKTETFTVVGIVESPAYISFTRGTSQIGDGSIDAFIMIPQQDFALEVYTDVYLTLESTKEVSPFVDEYDRLIEEKTEEFEQIAKTRAKERYDEIKDEAQAEIDKARAELADGEQQAEEELNDAKKKLDDAKKKLEDGKKEYESGLSEFRVQIADGKQRLADAQKELEDGQAEYESGLKQYEQGLAEFNEKKPTALEQIADYEKQAAELETQLESGKASISESKAVVTGIKSILTAYENSSETPDNFPAGVKQTIVAAKKLQDSLETEEPLPVKIDELLTQYIQAAPGSTQKIMAGAMINDTLPMVEEQIAEKEEQIAAGEAGLKQLTDGITAGKAELTAGEQKLNDSKTELDKAKQKLEDGRREIAANTDLLQEEEQKGQQRLEDAKTELDAGQAEYNKGLAAYNKGKAESDAKLADARQQIKDAEYRLADLAAPTWYVWNRDNNPGYAGYQDDAEKVDAIAQVFPVFFVLVAALVCLTTMTRLVEEERTQIGTLKALGYRRGSIVSKYLAYAALASILGSAIGLTIGFQLFPWVIIGAYKILYNMPDPMTPFRWDYAGICTLVAVLCTGLSALAACYKVLRTCPAQLMRPRAPKSGKRILLERVGFLWNRLSFIYKVTLRNIFRYKRRAAMTIIGVAGCTALMLTGFGMKYSITSIADKQYGSIFVYDAIAVTESNLKDTTELESLLKEGDEVSNSLMVLNKSMDLTNEGIVKNATLYVPQTTEQIGDFITLRERLGDKKLELTDEGVLLTEKLAKMLKAKAGDTVTINNPDGRPVDVKVLGITENYAMHFVYMTPKLYEEQFRETPSYNTVLLNLTEGSDKSGLSERLLKDGQILGVSYSDEGMQRFVDTMDSLNSIVWVLIISAGALALIVMYNLVNISVNERIRELATIKVLGFYDKETSAYIYRENNIAAAVGLAVGLVLGIFLERFVIVTAEVEAVMFSPEISVPCFLYAALLTILFTLIVNVTLYFQLKKISMVESLKSVE